MSIDSEAREKMIERLHPGKREETWHPPVREVYEDPKVTAVRQKVVDRLHKAGKGKG